MNINGQIVGVEEVQTQLLGITTRIREELKAEMEFVVAELVQYVVSDKLSGQVLNRITGKLAGSVSGRVTEFSGLVGTVYANTAYAGIQEYGGRTAAHEILPTIKQSLRFPYNGEVVFAKKVNHPGSRMPERSYLRAGLADLKSKIIQDLQAAVVRAIKS